MHGEEGGEAETASREKKSFCAKVDALPSIYGILWRFRAWDLSHVLRTMSP